VSNQGASAAISTLNTVLKNAESERERMANLLSKYHTEFSHERQKRLDAEAEVVRLKDLLSAKTGEAVSLTERNATLEREVKIMVSAIEVAGEQIRDNQRAITDSVSVIANDFPLEFMAATDEADDGYGLDASHDGQAHHFNTMERELISLMSSSRSPSVVPAL
jgi:predicted  nucleic acid-binding Zn-ribbon protein